MSPNYRSYPTDLEVPKRSVRKTSRRNIFQENKALGNKNRKARRIARAKQNDQGN